MERGEWEGYSQAKGTGVQRRQLTSFLSPLRESKLDIVGCDIIKQYDNRVSWLSLFLLLFVTLFRLPSKLLPDPTSRQACLPTANFLFSQSKCPFQDCCSLFARCGIGCQIREILTKV